MAIRIGVRYFEMCFISRDGGCGGGESDCLETERDDALFEEAAAASEADRGGRTTGRRGCEARGRVWDEEGSRLPEHSIHGK